MKNRNNLYLFIIVFMAPILSSCDYMRHIERKAKRINHYEKVALNVAKENRELLAEIDSLKYEIKGLQTQNDYLEIKLKKYKESKGIVPDDKIQEAIVVSNKMTLDGQEDLVQFKIYKWDPEQLLAIAENSFNNKDYEKAAQFFYTYLLEYPQHSQSDDRVLFQAGVSSYKSKNHFYWALEFLNRLIQTYPASEYFRGAKLWVALTYFNQGESKKFYKIVDEFRLKYRNTEEWKILSGYYEEFTQKYKK